MGGEIRIATGNALIEERCAKVYAWKNSNQRHRWLGTALLDIEPRLRRVRDYRPLPELRDASKRGLKIEQDPTRSMIRGRRGRLEFQLTMGLDSLYLLNINIAVNGPRLR